jgi:hypothetical protein
MSDDVTDAIDEVAHDHPCLLLIADELTNARAEYPRPFASPHEGYAVLLEEVDELKREVWTDGSKDRMRAEAIQVAAMALRFVEDLT